MLQAGTEPGLRFACVINGKGGCEERRWEGVAAWRPEDGFLWIHLERDTPERRSPGSARRVASIRSSRKHCSTTRSRLTIESFDHALLLVLRGVNIAEKDEGRAVPMHVWIDQHRAIYAARQGPLADRPARHPHRPQDRQGSAQAG